MMESLGHSMDFSNLSHEEAHSVALCNCSNCVVLIYSGMRYRSHCLLAENKVPLCVLLPPYDGQGLDDFVIEDCCGSVFAVRDPMFRI